MLSSDVVTFIEGGQDSRVATCNARREPYGCRVIAAVIEPDGVHLTAFVPAQSAEPILANLRSNPLVALCFQRPTDDRACQIKGAFVRARVATAEDRRVIDGQLARLGEQYGQLALPWEVVSGWSVWPAVAVTIQVNAVFDQTPGPGAGAPLA
jgi:hypothetical protein